MYQSFKFMGSLNIFHAPSLVASKLSTSGLNNL